MSEPKPPASSAAVPKLIVAYGRGGSGKSTCLRYLVERAQHAGREVIIADADPRATLSGFFDGVLQPAYSEEAVVSDWLDSLVNAIVEAPTTIVLDRNGGDMVFGRFAASLGLTEMLASVGVLPVALHMIGPDPDDLADLERADGFGVGATVLILNAGSVKDARPAEASFAAVRAHRSYRAALDRGAREVVMPRLPGMVVVNALRLPFEAAKTDNRIGMTDRQRVTMWLRAADQAFAPVAEWLP